MFKSFKNKRLEFKNKKSIFKNENALLKIGKFLKTIY
jgi:hypothetical protein